MIVSVNCDFSPPHIFEVQEDFEEPNLIGVDEICHLSKLPISVFRGEEN